MKKDLLDESMQLISRLREQYFKTNDYLQKGKYKMRLKYFPGGKQHYDFDMNSQEYLCESLDKVAFEPPEVQEHFLEQFGEVLEEDLNFNQKPSSISEALAHECSIKSMADPRLAREVLARHFYWRIKVLEHKKHLTMLRFHNHIETTPESLKWLQNRLHLLDLEIQACQNRHSRLKTQDLFEESYGVSRPIAVNEQGQQTYRALEDEECWFTNVARDDIEVYLRNQGHRENVLKEYWPLHYQFKYLGLKEPISIMESVEIKLSENQNEDLQRLKQIIKNLVSYLQTQIQTRAAKQDITNFIYKTYGLQDNRMLLLPLYPCFKPQLLNSYPKALFPFFDSLTLTRDTISSTLPKLNNFVAIVFKYQNKDVLLESEQPKLGLEDDIDIRKELCALLEESWVKEHVKLQFQLFDRRMLLIDSKWPKHNYTEKKRKHDEKLAIDYESQVIIGYLDSHDYHSWRKHIKQLSQEIVKRGPQKLPDCCRCKSYQLYSNEDLNLEYLNSLYHIKTAHHNPQQTPLLKPQLMEVIKSICEKDGITNPVEVEMRLALLTIKMRDMRSRIRNVLNAGRCYFKRLSIDLRKFSLLPSTPEFDDQVIIDSNKQERDNFQKVLKQSPNPSNPPTTQSHIIGSVPSGSAKTLINPIPVEASAPPTTRDIYKYDRIVREKSGDQKSPVEPLVATSDKRKFVVYDITFKDLKEVERRLLETASKFINKFQGYLKVKNLQGLVDRHEVLFDLYEAELTYQIEKFALLEVMMLLYKHTVDPADCMKLAEKIFVVMQRHPEVDQKQPYFLHSYKICTESLTKQRRILFRAWQKMVDREISEVDGFHRRLRKTIKVPYFRYGVLYGQIDMAVKMNRNNSLASLKSSRSSHAGGKSPVRLHKKSEEIQEVSEDDVQWSDRSSVIEDIANYDEYLLTRDLDQIFDEIARDDPNTSKNNIGNNLKEQVTIENKVVHRRFEGGPHFLIQLKKEGKCHFQFNKVEFMNFFEYSHWVVNFIDLLQQTHRAMYERYGFCSHQYQIQLNDVLLDYGLQILNSPTPLPKALKSPTIHWDDAYLLLVKCQRTYKDLMGQTLDPPVVSSLVLHHTLPKHLDSIPPFQQLQHLDYHHLESLVTLKKPLNIINYRELMMAINMIDAFRYESKLRDVALRRKQLSLSYKALGRDLKIEVKKYLSIYHRVLDSIFTAVQELKINGSTDLLSGGVSPSLFFPEAVDEYRTYVFCQTANLTNLQTFIKLQRCKYDPLIRLQHQLMFSTKHKCFFKNGMIDPNRINLLDANNMKTLTNRCKSLLSSRANAFREFSYLKTKSHFKSSFDKKLAESIALIYTDSPAEDKASKLMNQKKVKMLTIDLVECYGKDLLRAAQERSVYLQLLQYTQTIRKQMKALPFTGNIWTEPDCNHFMEEKFYFDQKDYKINIAPFGNVFNPETRQLQNPYYLYSQEQIMEGVSQVEFTTSIERFSAAHYQQLLQKQKPPILKQEFYKWFFKQSESGLLGHQSRSFRFMQRLNKPFSGGRTKYDDRCIQLPLHPSSNHLLKLLNHYKTLELYLQSQLIVMSFSGVDVDLLREFLDEGKNFQKLYPLIDTVDTTKKVEVSVRSDKDKTQSKLNIFTVEQQKELYEKLQKNIIGVLYVYQVKEMEIMKKTKKIIQESAGDEIKANNTIVIDETMDFLVRRVQGLGLVRETFLPFVQEMKLLGNVMVASNDNKVLEMRSTNIERSLYLSLYELYRKWPGGQDQLTNLYNHWFYPNKVGTLKTQSAKCYPLNQSHLINYDEAEKYIYSKKLQRPKKDLFCRLRCAILALPIDFTQYMWRYIKPTVQKPIYEYCKLNHIDDLGRIHVDEFLTHSLEFISEWKQSDRLRMLARMKNIHQFVLDYLELKVVKPQQVVKSQELKLEYLKLLVKSNVFATTLVYFNKQVFLPLPTAEYTEYYFELKDRIDSRAVSILNNFDDYSEKMQLSKIDKALIQSPLNLLQKQYEHEKTIHTRIFRQVICLKLFREELKCKLLKTNIDILTLQRVPVNEPRKVINPGLIPRVKLHTCFSSPLVVDRKTYISQQYKLSFVQAFINRLRNKVSRVDLLSSGYGFVITVSDLQDCVNFLNKSLFTFTEKQFKYRSDTFGYYYDMFADAIDGKNRQITELKSLLDVTRMKLNNANETICIQKINNLLVQNLILAQKVQMVEDSSRGLEDRVRKAVTLEFQARIKDLETQNKALKKRFQQYKSVLTILTKTEARSSFLNLVNELKTKASDLLQRTLDLGSHIPGNIDQQKKRQIRVSENPTWDSNSLQSAQSPQHELISQQDIQKCKIGEAIIHDPYYVTKLINKMRLFNVLKMATQRSREQTNNTRLQKQLAVLNKIHDASIMQTQKEIILRQELTKTQQQLADKVSELEYYKLRCDGLQGENDKLRIENLTKEKKLQQKGHNDSIILPEITKLKEDLADRQSRISRLQEKEKVMADSYQKLRVRERAKIRMLDSSQIKTMALTEPLPDGGTLQLSNKQLTWQEKCHELYATNRNFERQMQLMKEELQALRNGKILESKQQKLRDPRQQSADQKSSRRKIQSVLSETQKGGRSSEVSTERRRSRFNASYKYMVSRGNSEYNY